MPAHGLDWRLAVKEAPGSFLVLDPDLIIVEVSETFLNSARQPRSDVVGRSIHEVISPNATPAAAFNLRTPLMLILGATRRLLNSTPLSAAQHADLRTIQRSANELLDLVNHRPQTDSDPGPTIPGQHTGD